MSIYGVPTNDELEANGPDDAWTAVRNWLARHPTPVGVTPKAKRQWLDWAATNLINDPEVKGFIRKAKD